MKNELVLLDNALDEEQANRETPLADDVAFELFACEQALKSYELSPDDYETGRIGGGNDGGIDGVYVFLGETVLAEDAEVLSDDKPPSSFEKGLSLTLWVVQAKRERSFSETAIDKLESSLRRLLDLQSSENDLLSLYSASLVSRIKIFTDAWTKLATRKPRVQIEIVYSSRGETRGVDPKVVTKGDDLKALVGNLVPGAAVNFTFLGASELWQKYNTTPSYNLELRFQESLTSGSSHVAIVSLDDYLDFISEPEGGLRKHIFDWNVRDYQGDVEVNREIRMSLVDSEAPEFWWLNNGVTIVCSEASIVGKKYILHDVQVVNGLQTSHSIFNALSQAQGTINNPSEARVGTHETINRGLLVRILPTRDPKVRDQVIRATNRQTTVPVASLRATDEIQRNIESFFEQHQWYYDRRKNYWRNTGKSPDRIVSIPFLAQAVMAMGLGEPNNSRARPSSLLKRDEDYHRVFSNEISLETYLWLGRTQRRVDSFLSAGTFDITGTEKTNYRFYVSMVATMRAFRDRVYHPRQLSELSVSAKEFTAEEMERALNDVRRWAAEFMSEREWQLDKTAKSKEFKDFVQKLAVASEATG